MSTIMDEWLKFIENADEFANDLMHKINQRNQYPTNTPAFAKSDLYIKELFRKFQKKCGQLQETLNQLANLNKLTQREKERRQKLLDNLNDRCRKIENLIQNPGIDKRAALFSYGNDDDLINQNAPTVGWNEGLNFDSNQSVSQMRETQRNIMNEQDQGLDALSAIIARQKSLAQGIDSELNLHNEILNDIGDAMDDNNERLLRNTRNIRYVGRKSGTCLYWTIIMILLIAIVIVSLVPN